MTLMLLLVLILLQVLIPIPILLLLQLLLPFRLASSELVVNYPLKCSWHLVRPPVHFVDNKSKLYSHDL